MGWCLCYLYFYSNRSTRVLVCLLLLSPGLWKLSRDHDERNMVLLVCCIVGKWDNSKRMWFQIYSYHSTTSLTCPIMGYLQVFRMYNPSDEVHLVKLLPAQDCWKVGRFLKRPLVVALCYSEAMIITEETNDGMDVPQKCCLRIKECFSSESLCLLFCFQLVSCYTSFPDISPSSFFVCFCLFVNQLFTSYWR